ncbi:phage-related protein [Actinoplanes campanulatus]|uniref:Phage-related protein n=1 Tax=Actinoplanes campanulatus TaxID=113559 RepID=A0A7W5FIC9_9ACTN|nr:hypothetical protein [Actinoplanes campanulatus]MBB3099402.1 phage-related protein [Actinoplanes campanulatus]GGN40150.1 hypothetical protein GCM10010109_68840 [Actinoplanes campanulatus]GID42389.1 hypothetical protein Aca09nite_88950 [Actinoplanes campanulatus]
MPSGELIGRLKVKILPDTSEFKARAQRQLNNIEDDLDDMEVTIHARVDDEGVEKDAEAAERKAQNAVDGITIKVDLDSEDSIRQAMKRLDNEMKKVTADFELPVTLDEQGIKDAQKVLQEKLQVHIEADNAEYAQLKERIQDYLSGIKIRPDLDEGAKDRAFREIETLMLRVDKIRATITPSVDDRARDQAEREIKDLEDKVKKIRATIEPELQDSAPAIARLAALTRDRFVKIIPEVSEAAAAKVSATLAALSGARAVTDMFNELWTSISNLDKAAPKIAALSLAVAGLGASGIASVSNMAALAASLAQIGAVALTLPGTIGAFAIGLGTTYAALKDFNKVVPDAKAHLSELQDVISGNFWEKAKAPFQELVDGLLPQFSAGVSETATALGGFFGSLATSLNGTFDGALTGMFTDLNESIATASTSTDAIAQTMLVLGEIGASYLPQLAGWFVNLANAAAVWLTVAQQDGSLKGWVDNGIQALADLWSSLVSVVSILNSIATAAQNAGGSGLSQLADGLSSIADAAASPAFQGGLTEVFASAHQAMDLIATRSGPAVKGLFASLGDTVSTVLPIVGASIGTLLNGLANGLSSGAAQTGTVQFFNGIANAVTALEPALTPLGTAFGMLMGTLGTFIGAVGDPLSILLGTMASAFMALAPAINPLIAVLGAGLSAAMSALAPVIMQVVTAFSQMVSGGLITTLQTVFTSLTPVIGTVGQVFGTILVAALQAIAPLLPIIANLFATMAPIIANLMTSLAPLVTQILAALGPALVTVMTALTPVVALVLQIATAVLGPILQAVGQVAAEALPHLASALSGLFAAIQPVLQALLVVVDVLMVVLAPAIGFVASVLINSLIGAINGVKDVFEGAVMFLTGMWDMFAGFFTGDWDRMWSGIKAQFEGIWNLIVGAFGIFMNIGILGVAGKVLNSIKAAFKVGFEAVEGAVKAILNSLRTGFDDTMNGLLNGGRSRLTSIRTAFSDAWTAIKTACTEAFDKLRTAFTEGVDSARDEVGKLPNKITSALSGLATLLVGAGRDVISGFLQGLKDTWGSVESWFAAKTAQIKDLKGPESVDKVLLYDAGQLVMGGFLKGLESGYDDVRKSLKGFTAEVGGTQFLPPTVGDMSASSSMALMRAASASGGDASVATQRILNYYAAPGSSISAEDDLFAAANRARMASW